MKLVYRSIGITLIIFGVLLGIFMLVEKQALPNFIAAKNQFALTYRLAATNFPFYAGICVLAGTILLVKDNKG